MKIIDIEYAKSIFDYNPDNGLLTRKVSTSNNVKVGDIAGCRRNDGYILININGTVVYAHRLAWTIYYGVNPMHIDHINMIKSDNRISNLRECKFHENGSNRTAQANNKSGVKGVSWCKRDEKWQAQITKNKQHMHLGYYSNIEDASKAYADAAEIYHGEFARINLTN